MTASTETPDERAQEIVHMLTTHIWSHIEAQTTIAAAIRAAVAAEREATAKICDKYADRMDRSAKAREDAGTPSYTAECKADAGQSLAKAIRERRP